MPRVRYKSRVRDWLRAHGITNAWLIRETGIHRDMYYAVEAGRAAAGGFYRRSVMRALGPLGATEAELFEPLPAGTRLPGVRPLPPEALARFRGESGETAEE